MDQIQSENSKKPLSPRYFQSTEMLHLTEVTSQPRRTFSHLNLHVNEFPTKTECEVCKKRGDILSYYMKMRETLEQDVSSNERKIIMLETKLASEVSLNDQLQQKLSEMELELSKIKANKQRILINHDYQLEDINKENMSLRNEIWQQKNEFNMKMKNLQSDLLNSQAEIQAKENDHKIINNSLKNHISALEKELNIMQLQLMESNSQVEKYEALNELLKSQVDTLSSNNESLTQIIANRMESDSIQTNQYVEIPQKTEAIFEMMQSDLNLKNGSTFTKRVLKLLKKQKKTNKPTRLNGSLTNQRKNSTAV